MKNNIKNIIAFSTICLIFSCNSTEKEDNNESEKKAQKPYEIKVTQVLELQPQKEIVLPGDLKAWQETKIFSKVKGFVKQIYVDRGSYVNEGQVLVNLEAPEILADRNEAKAKFYEAKANWEEEKARFTASKSTFQRLLATSQTAGSVSPFELEQSKTKMLVDSSRSQSSQEKVNAAKAYLDAKTQLLAYLSIKAPFKGIITEKNISEGALVGSSDAANTKPIFVIINSEKLRLTVAIPEIYSSQLIPKCEVYFKVSALPEKKFKARLARTSTNMQENIRSLMAEFDVENKNQTLLVGTFTDVHIPIKRTTNTMFVPQKAVVNSQEKTFVIKIKDKKTEWVDVKTGNVMDTLVEVFGNLNKGDLVVHKASEELKTGTEVIVVK